MTCPGELKGENSESTFATLDATYLGSVPSKNDVILEVEASFFMLPQPVLLCACVLTPSYGNFDLS